MDFILQAFFTHMNPTPDQMKAILQEFCRKNEENETKIGRLQENEVESQTENSRLRHENGKYQTENSKLRQEIDAKSEEIADLQRKYRELQSLKEQENSFCLEKLPSYSEWSSELELQGSRHSSTLHDLGLGFEPVRSGMEIGKIWDLDTFASF